MSKDTIYFAHGNGFPAGCYRQFLSALEPHFEVDGIDILAHSDSFPVTEHWSCLVDELLHHIERRATGPVIAVGHSLGGALCLLASYRYPALFKQVVMLDTPLISPLKAYALKWIKQLGLVDRVTPAKRTKNRRAVWDSKEEAREYFEKRSVFKLFARDCLEDYINHGLEKSDEGFRLRFDREIEYSIYRTYPHVIPREFPKVPTTLLYGKQSDIITSYDKRFMKKKYRLQMHSCEGTHMFPLEHPQAASAKLIHTLTGNLS
jgi:pimeloyl-ACP methyl ester carboxylesterase